LRKGHRNCHSAVYCLQQNASGQYLRTDDDGSRAEAANFSEFLEICLGRSPAVRGASSQRNRIEPNLLLKNPQETCFKALFLML
jgi:hypothetical protein